MKHAMIFIGAILVAISTSAQIEKGTWMLGANSNLGFNSYTPAGGGSDQSYFNIGTKAGYFVAPNFVLGANLEYINASTSGSSSSITTMGLFTRYYAGTIFFGAGYNSLSQSYSGGGSSVSYGSIPIEAGFVGFITRNIAIEPALVYSIATDSENGAMPGYAGLPFPAKSAFGLKIGFSLYLGRPSE